MYVHPLSPSNHLRASSAVSTIAPLATVQPLKTFIRDRLSGAQLQHEFQEQLSYQVPLHVSDATGASTALRWSHMFAVMEEAKRLFSVEDYAISQTSLEQVFLSFARQQAEDRQV